MDDFNCLLRRSCAIITGNFEEEKRDLLPRLAGNEVRVYEYEELKIGDAHEIIREAFISVSGRKYIVIFACSFNLFSQNALLKVLEEPPPNVMFLLCTTARNKLLQTVTSRLVVINRRKRATSREFPLDLGRLSVPVVYEYIKEMERINISGEYARELLNSLLFSFAKRAGGSGRLKESDLLRFERAIEAIEAKQPAHLIFLPLLLSITM